MEAIKRIYLCGFNNFPRGSASANYVQYLSLALAEAGYKVIIVSNINEVEHDYLKRFLSRTNGRIEVRPLIMSKQKAIHFFEYRFCLAKKITDVLQHEKVTSLDIVISYSSNCTLNEGLLHFCKKKKIPCGACIVEWYPVEYFGGDKKAYAEYRYLFEKLFTQYDFLLPISSKIEAYFASHSSCRLLRIPILADSEEYPVKPKKTGETWKIIYPANGKIKDSLSRMIKAISMLNDELLSKVEFHVFGVKEKYIRESITQKEYERLRRSLVLHSWLTYDELIALYNDAHYLLLAREDNQLTQANFPSKVIESMTHSVIPIVSDVGDYTRMYLKNGYDSLFIHGCSEEQIAEALKRACSMKDSDYMTMSGHAYHTIQESFDYKTWSERLKCFMNQIPGGSYDVK